MINEILTKIDLLIEMSKSSSNYETLKAELNEILIEIEQKQKELEELNANTNPEKYLKASDRIIDENIKVSLELKIKKLEKSIRKKEKELSNLLSEEKKNYQEVKKQKEKILRLSTLIDTLKNKLSSNNTNYYQNLIQENELKQENLQTELINLEQIYQEISGKLALLTSTLEQEKEKLQQEKQKLNSTIRSLASNESYIDYDLEEEDKKHILDLQKELEELEKRKEEILNDAVLIGNEAKELLLEEDKTNCLLKIKELVAKINTLPFMNIDSSKDIETILKDALESTNIKRDEFASLIENKKYDTSDNQIILQHQKHLETKKQKLEEYQRELLIKVQNIDTRKILEINELLNNAIQKEESIKLELIEYQQVLTMEENNSTPRKKASLSAAFHKKEEELHFVQEIINSYEEEIENLVLESNKIVEQEMKAIEEEINKINQDIKDISKKIMMSSKTKDLLAMEHDKAKLKELNEEIAAILNRQKYRQSPNEIFDEIEMSLNINLTKQEIEKTLYNSYEQNNILNDFRITEDLEEPSGDLTRTEKNKDVLNEEEPLIIEDTFDLPWEEIEEESLTISPEEIADVTEEPKPVNIEELFSTSKISEEKPVTERLKVIQVEPLETPQENSSSQEDDVLIGDIKDDDYVDFNSIIGG